MLPAPPGAGLGEQLVEARLGDDVDGLDAGIGDTRITNNPFFVFIQRADRIGDVLKAARRRGCAY